MGEGGFGVDPLWVVSSSDEEHGGGVEPHSVDLQQGGRGLADEGSQQPVETFGLLSQILDPLPQGPDGDQGGVSDRVVALAWSERRGHIGQRDCRQPTELGTGRGGSGEDHVAQLVQHFDAGVDCGAAGDHQHSERFHVAVAGLG